MTRKIFRSILLVAAAVLLASLVIITGVLFRYFDARSAENLRTQARLIAAAVENEGVSYLEGLDDDGDTRKTLIAADGSVIFDSSAGAETLENHSDREEVIQAKEEGLGESERYSKTLAQKTSYCAVLLSDGGVVRLARTQSTVFALVLGMLQPIIIVLALALLLSALLASRLSKSIVKPLLELNPDAPEENEAYEELRPLLLRLRQQQREIYERSTELQRQRERFDAITENMEEGLVLIDADRRVISANGAFERLFDSYGLAGADVLTIGGAPVLQSLVLSALDGRRAETELSRNGGEYQLIASPVRSEDGSFGGAVLLTMDISARREAERRRREFTANVSHELKTPLHAISGSAEIILGGLVKPEDRRRFIERIYSEARRLILLVDDIIRLSRLDESGEAALLKERVDLFETARDAVGRLATVAEAQGVTLTVSGVPVFVMGVPGLLSDIVYNLCDNAVKYNRPGGSAGAVVSREGDCAVLTVSDTGVGIAPEHRERIFERFYRVDKSHSRETGGTGLGLSIVKHAAAVHNAEISLESEEGAGTTIKVRFPEYKL